MWTNSSNSRFQFFESFRLIDIVLLHAVIFKTTIQSSLAADMKFASVKRESLLYRMHDG